MGYYPNVIGLKMPTGAGAGKVLTSDADGDASWAAHLGVPAGTTTGDMIRYNSDSGLWETSAEPFSFKGIVLTPQAASLVSVEGAIYFDSALKTINVGITV